MVQGKFQPENKEMNFSPRRKERKDLMIRVIAFSRFIPTLRPNAQQAQRIAIGFTLKILVK